MDRDGSGEVEYTELEALVEVLMPMQAPKEKKAFARKIVQVCLWKCCARRLPLPLLAHIANKYSANPPKRLSQRVLRQFASIEHFNFMQHLQRAGGHSSVHLTAHYSTAHYSTAHYSTAQHSTAPHRTAPHSTAQHDAVPD